MSGRLILGLAVLISWLLTIVVRLYDLQIVEHERFVARAANQQQREVVLDAPRGTIRDARGRELAVSIEVQSVAADPQLVEDAAATAAQLAELLALDRRETATLKARLESDRRFVWVARKADPHRADAVLAAELPGVFLLPESKRFYPLRQVAGALLGFVGTDNIGLGGLEARYDKVVSSRPGRRVIVQDGRDGKALYPGLEHAEARPGKDLRLTLDATIQHLVEHELAVAVRDNNARQGTIVVLEPHTGAVLAMASHPGLDPNRWRPVSERDRRNPAIADAFEPGSTFKIVTLAAALERGAVDLDDTFDCERGALIVHGRRIRDHHPFGLLSVRQVLAKSSNVGAMKIGFAAGKEAFYDTVRGFGFGRLTGIDLPGENAGLLRPIERWSALTPAYVSFGQGISATALQMAVAFAVVANGGHRVRPHVVSHVGGEPVPPPARAPVPVSADTVRALRSAMESVVVEGTGTPAAVAGYRVAGKTGTAQKAIGAAGYAANRYVASFIGFVPVEKPALVIAVVIDEPWPTYHGSQAAAPAFAAIAHQALLYLGVRPLREPPKAWPGERPRLVAALDDSAPGGLAAATIAAGPSLSPALSPAYASTLSSARAVADGTMPDFVGLTKRASLRRAGRLGLRTGLHGSGFVARQVPPPGTPLERSAYQVELWLSPTLDAAEPQRGGR